MTQNREPPAYQEYASTMLARREFRFLSLAERGLLYSMRLECWCNRDLPESPAAIARLLGFERSEVEAALPAVMPFFTIKGGLIVCPELDDLRATYAERRERQAEGGKRSADKRKAKGQESPPSTLQVPSKHPESNLQVCRPDQTKPDQSKAVSRKEVVPCDEYREWMGEKPASSERPGMVEVEI